MLSLTAKHFVTDISDNRGVVVHPPAWVVSIESAWDQPACLTYFDRHHAISARCENLAVLAGLLKELRDFGPGVDTAVHRSYYQYEFWFKFLGKSGWEQQSAQISLNSCADSGDEPKALKPVLAWFEDHVRSAAPHFSDKGQFKLWSEPEDWGRDDMRDA